MASLENMDPAAHLANLQGMDEAGLLGQQLVQQGAIHAVTFLLANGCSEALAIEMLASLRKNMETVCQIAAAKGYTRLFSDVAPNFN